MADWNDSGQWSTILNDPLASISAYQTTHIVSSACVVHAIAPTIIPTQVHRKTEKIVLECSGCGGNLIRSSADGWASALLFECERCGKSVLIRL